MDLSLRDLALRSSVSAPTVTGRARQTKQPDPARRRTNRRKGSSPSLAAQADEDGAETVVSRRRAPAAPVRSRRPQLEILTPPLPGQRAELSRHTLAPGAVTGGKGDPPMHAAGSRDTALVQAARSSCTATASPTTRGRRLRDLRCRPAAPFREPRRPAGRPARGCERRPQELTTCPRACSTRLEGPRGSPGPALDRPGPGSEVTSRRRSTACGWPAARSPDRPDARHRRTTTCRRTGPRSRHGSKTSCHACRSSRWSETATSSACRCTRWDRLARGSSM